MDRSGEALISIVFSFRNEAETIPALLARVEAVFTGPSVDYELVFVNDASTDGSLDILLEQRRRNTRIKILNMSRRFGVAECLFAGFSAASGDAVIYLDTDLQDPPELIPALIERWRKGAGVVHTVRTRRHGESALKMLATRIAYRLIRFSSSIEIPVNAGDFKLLSREAVDHLLRLRESDPYLRGLSVWLGFKQDSVTYEREVRHAGVTHFPFFSKNPWKTFLLGVTSFSFYPIYVGLGLAVAGLAGALLLMALAAFLALGGYAAAVPVGFLGLLTFFWATTLLMIGAVGIYVIRTYKDARGRPAYIVESSIGFPENLP
jgi:dolichol-phosphate mannosyltransferase